MLKCVAVSEGALSEGWTGPLIRQPFAGAGLSRSSLELKHHSIELASHAVHVRLARCTTPPELLVLALP